ncbi:Uncharacterised protein [Mycobacterium tuberculosis]|nr:Uncharacterised protein [Mycobacterium tuberculosis]
MKAGTTVNAPESSFATGSAAVSACAAKPYDRSAAT